MTLTLPDDRGAWQDAYGTWKGLKYLQDEPEIASAFEITSGFFEIGALLALDAKWQKLDKIRILMAAKLKEYVSCI